MTHIPAIEAHRAINSKSANYNAVKIQINNPQTNVPEGFKASESDNGIYNAVNIEVNKPQVNVAKKPVYEYPKAKHIVTSDMINYNTMPLPQMPVLPVAYQTNWVNNKTLINAEFEFENLNKTNTEAQTVVPEANFTTPNAEKKLAFHGLSFKGDNKIEIVPPIEIKPEVDISGVVSKLSNEDFDIQAQQMEEIAKASMEAPEKVLPYIVTEVFNELINITTKDTSDLTPPSAEQIETRKKIIINELVKEQTKLNDKENKNIEVPYNLTKDEIANAMKLTSMEKAERNKEYALYSIAILAKVYTDEVEKHSGNIVPLTDLPGISTIVDTLRNNQNPSIKIAAIDALRYIRRPEYNEELNSIFNIATNDSNNLVAQTATVALENA